MSTSGSVRLGAARAPAGGVLGSVVVVGSVESYADLARRILDRPARLGRTRLVAIDGPSGSGKSVFAERLARALSGAQVAAPPAATAAPPIVHTDDLLDGWADQFTFWPRLEEWILTPLRAGQSGHYRRYDWHRRRFTPDWITVPPTPVVLVDGVSTARSAIAPELSYAIFVTAPAALGLARALERDGATLRPYLMEWRRGEERHFAADATAARADLVVDGAPCVPHDPASEYVRRA
jgi:uridine kinase